MNDVDARGVPVYGGFHAEFRKVHKSAWEQVRKNGVIQIYDTQDQAEVAAWRTLKEHLCGIIRRDGDVVSIGIKSEREAVFSNAIFKRGRKITVVRK